MTKDAAQHRSWTFCEAVNVVSFRVRHLGSLIKPNLDSETKATRVIEPKLVCLPMVTLLVVMFFFSHNSVAASKEVGTIDSAGIERLIKANEGAMVIVAMAAWCLPCRQELPTLVKLYDKYRKTGLKMVGISLDLEGSSAIQPVLDEARVNFPVYWAGEQAVYDLKITAIPLMFLVSNGKIVERIMGLQSEKFLDQKISGLLNRNSERIPRGLPRGQ